MPLPIRSIRLEKRSSKSLDTLSGSSGEIFFDGDRNTLRLYTANQADNVIMADRDWVLDNTVKSWNDLEDKPFIPIDASQLTDTGNRFFSGDYNDLANAPDLDALNVDISTIDSIGDVDTTSNPLANGQLLQWDGTTWVNTTVAGFQDTNTEYTLTGGSTASGGSIILEDSDGLTNTINFEAGSGIGITLTDTNELTFVYNGTFTLGDASNVSITNPADGQTLIYSNGQWLNGSPSNSGGVALTDFSITQNPESGNGALTYDNTTGIFEFTPADLSSVAALDAFSVTTDAASGGGSLSYDNNGGFTFRPANLSQYTTLSTFSITTAAANGSGGLSYNNTTGEFTFEPADLSGAGGDLVTDTTPQLGGDLDLNTNNITGTGNVNITGSVTATSFSNGGTGAPTITSATTITFDAPDGTIVQNGPFRLPSFTTTEKNNIVAVNGDMVYDSTLNKAQVYENGAWVSLV